MSGVGDTPQTVMTTRAPAVLTNKECGSGFFGKCEFEVDVAKD